MDDCGTESQSHGFFWENYIKEHVFKIREKAVYTCVHDIDKEFNSFDPRENISIKTMGADTLFLGSARRIIEYSPSERHTCIVVVYRQIGDIKQLTRVVEFSLDARDVLFGDVTIDDIVELEGMLRLLPKSGRIPKELRELSEIKKRDMNKRSASIQFNIKIDSKTQRRLQCSIPKFDAFLTKYADRILLYDTPLPVVREVEIPRDVRSGPRTQRVKKGGRLSSRKTARSSSVARERSGL